MKRILVIQDICVIGKSSGNVSSAIFSAMGIEVVFVPVSVNISKWECNGNDKEGCCYTDLSDKLCSYSKYFVENKIHFDGIFISGCFTGSQIKKIDDLMGNCFTDDCFIILNISNDTVCDISLFKNIYEKSNVLILNLREAAVLSGFAYDDKVFADRNFVENLILKTEKSLGGNIVVTGFCINDKKKGIALAEKNKNSIRWFYHNIYNSGFYGLYDIFSAVIAGNVIKKMSLEESVKKGIEFTEKAVKNTLSKPAHNWYGADFEKCLAILQPSDSLP